MRQTRLSLSLYGRGIRIIVSRRSALEERLVGIEWPGTWRRSAQFERSGVSGTELLPKKLSGLILDFRTEHYVFQRLRARAQAREVEDQQSQSVY